MSHCDHPDFKTGETHSHTLFTLPVSFLSSGGKVGDTLSATAVCDKSRLPLSIHAAAILKLTLADSWEDTCLHPGDFLGQAAESGCQGQPHQVSTVSTRVCREAEPLMLTLPSRFVVHAIASSTPFTPPEGAPVAEDGEPSKAQRTPNLKRGTDKRPGK